MKKEKRVLYLTASGIADEKKHLFALEFTIVDQKDISCIVVVNSETGESDKESPVYPFNEEKCTIEFLHSSGSFVEGTISLRNISATEGVFTAEHNTFLFALQYGTNRERTHSLLGIFYLKTLEVEEVPEEISKPIEKADSKEEKERTQVETSEVVETEKPSEEVSQEQNQKPDAEENAKIESLEKEEEPNKDVLTEENEDAQQETLEGTQEEDQEKTPEQ